MLSQGPLPSTAGWSSYVTPLSLDLTSDGVFAVYGYSGQVGIVPNATFSRGHYAILADTKTNLPPVGQTGYTYPTTFGRRVVAAQGSQVVVQPPADPGAPFATTWAPIIETSASGLELRRTDIAATGQLAAIELAADPGDDRIGVVSLSGMVPPVAVGATVNCLLPTVGEASDPSISQDGTLIAWKDAQGVKVAGVPRGTTAPCALSSPPIVISATGSYPSIGGGTPAQLQPSAPTPGSPAAKLLLTLPARPTAAALAGAKGIAVKVRVPAAGRVKVTGSIVAKRLGLKGRRQVVVATGSARPTAAGTVTVRLRLTKAARIHRAPAPRLHPDRADNAGRRHHEEVRQACAESPEQATVRRTPVARRRRVLRSPGRSPAHRPRPACAPSYRGGRAPRPPGPRRAGVRRADGRACAAAGPPTPSPGCGRPGPAGAPVRPVLAHGHERQHHQSDRDHGGHVIDQRRPDPARARTGLIRPPPRPAGPARSAGRPAPAA